MLISERLTFPRNLVLGFRDFFARHSLIQDLAFKKSRNIFCPTVLTHKLSCKVFFCLRITRQKIIIITFYYVRVNSEIIVFRNEELLNFKLGKAVLYINDEVAEICSIACRISIVPQSTEINSLVRTELPFL